MMASFLSVSNSEQKEQTNKENMSFIADMQCITNSHKSEKNTKKHQNDVFGRTHLSLILM